MEIRTLQYFLAVAREQNMTEAANVLHVTQPTLSRQIADLERELGCRLFDRTNRSTVLTGDGMRLRQRAEEILSLVDQTREELAGDDGELAGNIRIGAGEAQSMRVLTDAFVELRRGNPKVTCELFTGNADTVEERLERGLLDFALLLEPVSNLDAYESLRLPIEDVGGVAVGPDSPWADLDAVTPEVLAGMPLLISSRTTHQSFDCATWSGGAVTRDDLDVVGTYDLLGNASLLIQTGEACALCIDHLLEEEGGVIRFIPLEPRVTVGSYVIWKRYRIFSRACEAYLELLKQRCGEGDGGRRR